MDKKDTAKERIMQTAANLFYREGIRAVGIDRIIAESGVAKASFYRNFPSKDDLVGAFLDFRLKNSLLNFEEARRRFPDNPSEQIFFLIDNLIERMKLEGFRGCPFLNTIVEFPETDHPVHRKAAENHGRQWTEIRLMAESAGAADPEGLVEQLRLLTNGAIITAYLTKSKFNAEYFSSGARRLVKSHLPKALSD